LRTVSRNCIIAGSLLMALTKVLKLPLQFRRSRRFCTAIWSVSPTLSKLVAKWSCQNSTSFSCSWSLLLIMYFTHLLWMSSTYRPPGLNFDGSKSSR